MALAKGMAVVICLLIVATDITAGILGIKAELAQNKVRHVRVWIFECREPSYQAFKLGLAAAVLLAIAHAIANVFGGCVCVWSKTEWDKASPNQTLAAASLGFSWIILLVGFSMLMAGAVENSKSKRYCGLSHHHLLSIGGILCFLHGLLSTAYYTSANAFTTGKERNHSGAPA